MSTQEIVPAKWVRSNLLPFVFGISPGAARKYRERGDWLEGKHFNQKGRCIWYNRMAIEEWIEAA